MALVSLRWNFTCLWVKAMIICDLNGSLDLYLLTLRLLMEQNEAHLSMLDLCCGEMTITKHFSFHTSFHVDVLDRASRPQDAQFIQADAIDLTSKYPDNLFDVCFCFDGIEHFTKDKSYELMRNMQRVSKLAVIFTPDSEMNYYPKSDDPDAHKSLWSPADFEAFKWN